MEKKDLKRQFKELCSASARKVSLVTVPEMSFLMVDGEGNPNTAKSYKDAVEALYSVVCREIHDQAGTGSC